LEHNQEKIRLGLKQLLPDPIDYFKDKKKKDIITVIILETLDNGIKVKPDGCSMKILIKKNQIAINKEDQRTNRFNKGDKVDCMLLDLDLIKRKVSLSIKMLEEEVADHCLLLNFQKPSRKKIKQKKNKIEFC
jgi:small subunit ribosomal protein S1